MGLAPASTSLIYMTSRPFQKIQAPGTPWRAAKIATKCDSKKIDPGWIKPAIYSRPGLDNRPADKLPCHAEGLLTV